MIREYALDPAALSSFQNCRYLLEQFGAQHGRLIGEYPRKWKRAVFQALTCGELDKKRVEVLLQRLGAGCFAPRPGAPYDETRPWLENACQEDARIPFDAIIARDPPTRGARVLDAESLDASEPAWCVARDRHVPRAAERMAEVVAPLLRHAREIHLVDPYFRPDQADKFRPFIRYLVEAMSGRRIDKAPEVYVHILDEKAPAEIEAICRRAMPDLIPSNLRVTVHRWKVRPQGNEFHDRYILTDYGGVEFGAGLDERDEARTTRVSLLGEVAWRDVWERFRGPALAYDRVGLPIVIEGRRTPGPQLVAGAVPSPRRG